MPLRKPAARSSPYVIEARRPGDIAECYADPSKAKRELGWVAEYGIEEMCADSWNWQKKNPRRLPHCKIKGFSTAIVHNVENTPVCRGRQGCFCIADGISR